MKATFVLHGWWSTS
ncbi:trp operon leader peptide [Citrobacter portucalensis]